MNQFYIMGGACLLDQLPAIFRSYWRRECTICIYIFVNKSPQTNLLVEEHEWNKEVKSN